MNDTFDPEAFINDAGTAQLTTYWPGQGDPKMEGGVETSTATPISYIEDFTSGDKPYITVAGPKSEIGTWKQIDIPGVGSVPAFVNDTGPAIGKGHYDIPSRAPIGTGMSNLDTGRAVVMAASGDQIRNQIGREHYDYASTEHGPQAAETPFDPQSFVSGKPAGLPSTTVAIGPHLSTPAPAFDARAFLGAPPDETQQPQQTQQPAPRSTGIAINIPQASVPSVSTSLPSIGQQMPIPEGGIKPVIAIQKYVSDMIPKTREEILRSMNVPTDWKDPRQVLSFAYPMLKPALDLPQQIMGRAQQVRQSENTPAYSQDRWNAGVATVLDIAGMASVLRGAIRPKAAPPAIASEAVRSYASQEIPGAESFAGKINTPDPGMVRLYHGAEGTIGQAGRDFTPDLEYAKGYAAKSQNPQVWYVDVPSDAPFLSRDEGTTTPSEPNGRLINRQILPDEISTQAQRLEDTGSKPTPTAPEPLKPVIGSGKFLRSYRIDKELGDRMEGIGASYESGALRGEIASRNLTHELTPQQETDLGKYLVSRRLKTVNPDHPQILDAKEMRRIESDPAISKALTHYRDQIKPDIEALRKRAGLSEQAAAGKTPEFISLIPATNEMLPQPETVTQASRLSRTTRFAKKAEGFAKEYKTHVGDILAESYSEAIRKARVREFYDAVQNKGVGGATFEELPANLAHDLRSATEKPPPPIGMTKLLHSYQKFATGVSLTANPAELQNHMRRQLSLVAAKPPVGMGIAARLEALAPYFGPKLGTFARVVTQNADTPMFQGILKDVFDSGGGSTRSFGERYQSNIPIVKGIQQRTNKLLFGIPKGYGVNGWDLRMRVYLEQIRRAAEGNVDPQRMREFANQIGQYGSHTDWVVNGLKTINPYAATTLPMRLTELKTAVGSSGLKGQGFAKGGLRQAETFLRGTGGTLAALTTANYLLSGKWPWQNDKGHEFDLNTGIRSKDGKTVYVKLRAVAPELARPVSTVSLPDLAREMAARNPQPIAAALMGPVNQALSLVSGPGQNLALTAATGKVPYLLRRPGGSPGLLDVTKFTAADARQGKSRMLRQVEEAAKGLNPFAKVFGDRFDVQVPDALGYIEEPIPGIRPFGNIYSSSYERSPSSAPIGKSSRGRTRTVRGRSRRIQ